MCRQIFQMHCESYFGRRNCKPLELDVVIAQMHRLPQQNVFSWPRQRVSLRGLLCFHCLVNFAFWGSSNVSVHRKVRQEKFSVLPMACTFGGDFLFILQKFRSLFLSSVIWVAEVELGGKALQGNNTLFIITIRQQAQLWLVHRILAG